MPSDRTFEIHEVARLTGLAAARLRAWERRYEVVRPRRRPNGYRASTREQVALLRAFARLIGEGARIGELAARPRDEVLAPSELRLPKHPVTELLEAARSLDRERLDRLVAEELAGRGLGAFAQGVALPLAQVIGDQWALGNLAIAAEHLASEVVLGALKAGLVPAATAGAGPLVVGACLPGERHEWGFLSTLAVLYQRGWRIHYLGADLPVVEMVEATRMLHPRGVALSCSDPSLVRAALPALAALRSALPPKTIAAIGGGGVDPHAGVLRSYGFRVGLDALPMRPG
jgi:MerR family transcriptional regulator, light-induced transcriptional regulator